MICPELLKPLKAKEKEVHVDFERYRQLHHEGLQLISGWFKRAQEMKDCQGTECFEAFFYVWLAFNGWAVCVTDCDQDWLYIDVLKREAQLCQDFDEFFKDSTSSLAEVAKLFVSFWPIFNVKELRDLNMSGYRRARRKDKVRFYQENNKSFAPKCEKRHKDNGDALPIDWPHTLAALYQVRCNFFHGGKMLGSEEDQQIVVSAYRILLSFLEQGHYII